MHKPIDERLWAKVAVKGPDDCWEWQGRCNTTGYGQIQMQKKTYVVHRIAAWLEGLIDNPRSPTNRKGTGFILHICDNRRCCNPNHMMVGTYSENQQQAYDRGQRIRPCGELNWNAKLTYKDVERIKELHASGNYTYVALAEQYKVTPRVIRRAVIGESYV